jgi:peptide-methionine (S)-S-oxide reductase
MEPPFDKLKGVTATTSGYIGGFKKKPNYEEVSRGLTGHAEAVRITYDPEKVTYSKLLEVFWHNIDPTTPKQQFCDVGSQYRAAIFYHDETQRRLAEESKQTLEQSKRFPRVVVEIARAGEFYPAEDHHQDYYVRNPREYHEYRYRCGRDQRLQELWGETK